MINAEKLLGKILSEVTNSQSGKKKKNINRNIEVMI